MIAPSPPDDPPLVRSRFHGFGASVERIVGFDKHQHLGGVGLIDDDRAGLPETRDMLRQSARSPARGEAGRKSRACP